MHGNKLLCAFHGWFTPPLCLPLFAALILFPFLFSTISSLAYSLLAKVVVDIALFCFSTWFQENKFQFAFIPGRVLTKIFLHYFHS